jgi:hypothetical protein
VAAHLCGISMFHPLFQLLFTQSIPYIFVEVTFVFLGQTKKKSNHGFINNNKGCYIILI